MFITVLEGAFHLGRWCGHLIREITEITLLAPHVFDQPARLRKRSDGSLCIYYLTTQRTYCLQFPLAYDVPCAVNQLIHQ